MKITQIFVWSAIDVDTREYGFQKEEVAFLRMVLKYCENEPEFVVDRGTWYLWAFKRLGLKYRHETFGMQLKDSFLS